MAKQINKKKVGIGAGIIAVVAAGYGYVVSPDAITSFICMFFECVAK